MAEVDPLASISVNDEKQLVSKDRPDRNNQGKSHASPIKLKSYPEPNLKPQVTISPHFIYQRSIYSLPRISLKKLMYLSIFLKPNLGFVHLILFNFN